MFISSNDCGATVERVRWLHDDTMSGWSNASNIGYRIERLEKTYKLRRQLWGSPIDIPGHVRSVLDWNRAGLMNGRTAGPPTVRSRVPATAMMRSRITSISCLFRV